MIRDIILPIKKVNFEHVKYTCVYCGRQDEYPLRNKNKKIIRYINHECVTCRSYENPNRVKKRLKRYIVQCFDEHGNYLKEIEYGPYW